MDNHHTPKEDGAVKLALRLFLEAVRIAKLRIPGRIPTDWEWRECMFLAFIKLRFR